MDNELKYLQQQISNLMQETQCSEENGQESSGSEFSTCDIEQWLLDRSKNACSVKRPPSGKALER